MLELKIQKNSANCEDILVFEMLGMQGPSRASFVPCRPMRCEARTFDALRDVSDYRTHQKTMNITASSKL